MKRIENDLDLDGGWHKFGQFVLQSLRKTRDLTSTTRQVDFPRTPEFHTRGNHKRTAQKLRKTKECRYEDKENSNNSEPPGKEPCPVHLKIAKKAMIKKFAYRKRTRRLSIGECWTAAKMRFCSPLNSRPHRFGFNRPSALAKRPWPTRNCLKKNEMCINHTILFPVNY